jgi:signal transduction histidine kinase
MQNTLAVAKAITQADAGSLVLVNEQGEITHSTLTHSMQTPDVREKILSYVTKERLIDPVLEERKAILVDDTSRDSEWPNWPTQPYHVGSAMALPIYYGEQMIGGLVLLHANPHHFALSDIEVLETASRQMALALTNASVYEAQRLVAEQQAILFEVLRTLQRSMVLQDATAQAVDAIARLTGWPAVALLSTDVSTGLKVRAATGYLAEHILALFAEQEEKNTPHHFTNLDQLQQAIPEELLPSVIFIPLQGDTPYTLLIAADTPMAFDTDARMLANSLGNVLTLVLRNAQLYESVSTEQQRLAALIQSSRDGIILVGVDNRILVISQTAVDYLGLEGTSQDWLYRPMIEALSELRAYAPDVVRATISELRRLKHDTSPGEDEYQVKGRILHWANLPVMDDERALGRLLILRDVTEEHQVAQMRDDLTHTMVHDLRNPLTAIHGSVWLLKKQLQHNIPTNHRTLLDVAYRSTAQLLELVNAILDISRLESGRMPLERSIFAFPALVNNVLELQRPLASQKEIKLVNTIKPQPYVVQADQKLLGRVLQNLVGNALKFTPENGTVRVSSQLSSDKGTGNLSGATNKLLVSVEDTGPGIPQQIKEQLFQKFVTGQQEGHGSGLGLAFCKMVLEAHGEDIWVDSIPDEGTTFTFTLSLVEGQ